MRTPLLIASAALTAALLAGCGGNDPTPSPNPTPSPTVSPTGRVAPPLPPAATAHTKAGAIAFVRHYIDLINYAQATGDTKAIRAIEGSHCSSCKSANGYVERLYARGGRLVGGEIKIVQLIDAVANPGVHGFEIDTYLKFGPQILHEPNKPPKRLHGGTLATSFQSGWRSGGWEIVEWTRAQ